MGIERTSQVGVSGDHLGAVRYGVRVHGLVRSLVAVHHRDDLCGADQCRYSQAATQQGKRAGMRGDGSIMLRLCVFVPRMPDSAMGAIPAVRFSPGGSSAWLLASIYLCAALRRLGCACAVLALNALDWARQLFLVPHSRSGAEWNLAAAGLWTGHVSVCIAAGVGGCSWRYRRCVRRSLQVR